MLFCLLFICRTGNKRTDSAVEVAIVVGTMLVTVVILVAEAI
jgi:hypothetical protein